VAVVRARAAVDQLGVANQGCARSSAPGDRAAFLLIASGVLLWEGLASTMMREHPKVSREVRDAPLRLAIGFVGFAIALWIRLGMLTRPR
jgi:hypothetical protein